MGLSFFYRQMFFSETFSYQCKSQHFYRLETTLLILPGFSLFKEENPSFLFASIYCAKLLPLKKLKLITLSILLNGSPFIFQTRTPETAPNSSSSALRDFDIQFLRTPTVHTPLIDIKSSTPASPEFEKMVDDPLVPRRIVESSPSSEAQPVEQEEDQTLVDWLQSQKLKFLTSKPSPSTPLAS